jgi:Ca2+-binding EF-hand superfamily protein
MTASKKTAVAVLALMGAVVASAALADRGMGMGMGMGGGEGRGAMMLDQFDTIDADKDGKITQGELTAHRAAEFTAADTNSDGALSADELSAHMLAQMMARQGARMIENMDDDGNGSLSVEEMGEGPMAGNFARIDTDNDGAISKAEAEAVAEHMGKRREGRRHMMGDDDN